MEGSGTHRAADAGADAVGGPVEAKGPGTPVDGGLAAGPGSSFRGEAGERLGGGFDAGLAVAGAGPQVDQARIARGGGSAQRGGGRGMRGGEVVEGRLTCSWG